MRLVSSPHLKRPKRGKLGEGHESFVPFRRFDLIEMCLEDQQLDESEHASFKQLCQLLTRVFHLEFHHTREILSACYAHFEPSTDTIIRHVLDDDAKDALTRQLVDELRRVLVKGNFEELSVDSVAGGKSGRTELGVRLNVNLEEFSEVLLFARGRYNDEQRIRTWRWFGLRKHTRTVETYERIVIFARFRRASSEEIEAKARKRNFRKRRTKVPFEPDTITLKLFRDIPTSDIRMLFPNVEARMSWFDQLTVGLPAVVGGVALFLTRAGRITASVLIIITMFLVWTGFENKPVNLGLNELLTIAFGVGTLVVYAFRVFNTYKNRRISFLKKLSENLYYRNLVNDEGVLFSLIAHAEEEECKEAIVAYHFCLTHPDQVTSEQLDGAIEAWFRDTHQVELDFEIDDALDKLTRLGLITERGDGILSCLPLPQALHVLHKRWEALGRASVQYGLPTVGKASGTPSLTG